MTVTIQDIQAAATRIKSYLKSTPILTSSNLNDIVKAQLFFKCENFQKAGAFKVRGACNAVFSLSGEEAKKGVATHSSGNHGAALAVAAKTRGIPAYIVMPNNSAEVKKRAVAHYGAEIIYCEPGLPARQATLNEVVKKTGATFIHPYDNEKIIAGQGTVALEIVEKIKDLDSLIVPLGGGGLLAGSAISIKTLSPHTKIIGAEPLLANDAYLSFKQKKLVTIENANTICDGLLVPLGQLTLPLILKNVDDVFTASEASIVLATQYIWERMKIVVEPSAAIALAIILENPEYFRDKKIGLILSGGNVDIKKIAQLFI